MTGSGKAYTDTLPYTAEPDGDGYSDVIVVALDARSQVMTPLSPPWTAPGVCPRGRWARQAVISMGFAADTTVTFLRREADTFNGADLEGRDKERGLYRKVVSTPASNDTSVKEAKIGEIEACCGQHSKDHHFCAALECYFSEQTANVVMNAVVLNPGTGGRNSSCYS